MRNYVIEINDTGEAWDIVSDREGDAIRKVIEVMESRGHDTERIVHGDWDADGENDDGERCVQMLFWADEESAENDAGANAICKLCAIDA